MRDVATSLLKSRRGGRFVVDLGEGQGGMSWPLQAILAFAILVVAYLVTPSASASQVAPVADRPAS